MSAKIGILGAGLAGLSAAINLRGATSCEIFEREGRPGGLCRSRHIRGYVFDYGPHVFYTKSTLVKRLVNSALKRDGNRLVGKPRRAYIYLDGVYVKYPFEANLYPLPEKIKRECIAGAKNRKPRAGKNFSDWILSTFGKGIARHYMAPYNSKIWKYPLEMMATDWIAGRVPAPSLRDIISGANSSGRKDFGGNRHFHYPLFGGTGAIPSALALGLEGAISCGSEVTGIKKRKQGLEVAFVRGGIRRKKTFRRLVSTLPLPELVPKLDDVPGPVECVAKRLIHNSSVCVNLGIGRPAVSDKHWVYFPEKKYVFNRISFPGNFSASTVPRGRSSVLTEVTYRSRNNNAPPKPKEYYVGEVIDGLRDAEILGRNEEPETVDVAVLKYAYVVYDVMHAKNAKLVLDYLEGCGILAAGRFGEWEYLNMDASILSGRSAALRLLRT